MKVSDIMTKAVVMDVADDTLSDAAAKMRAEQTGSLLIMDGDRLVGIFTERDLLNAIAKGLDPGSSHLKEHMATDVVSVDPETSLREAAGLMGSRWIRHLPVVEGERVVGMISARDLAGVLTQIMNEPESPQGIDEGELVRTRRLKRIEAGDLD